MASNLLAMASDIETCGCTVYRRNEPYNLTMKDLLRDLDGDLD